MPNKKSRSGLRCATLAPDKKSITGRDRLTWREDGVRLLLYHGSGRSPLAIVEPDAKYPFLYRIRYPDGHLSDMVNLTRAKDAACWFALRSLNSPPQETLAQGSQARKKAELGGNIGQSVNRAPLMKRRNSISGQWVAHRIEMLEASAFRALSRSAHMPATKPISAGVSPRRGGHG